MIRHRVSTHGHPRPMEPESSIPALCQPPDHICVIHPGPTSRWLSAKTKWDRKYAKQKRRVQLLRGKEYLDAQARGFLGGELRGEMPPASALAGRPSILMAMEGDTAVPRKNLAGWMWGIWGGMADREVEVGKDITPNTHTNSEDAH
jgi:hypothetical protein